MWSSKKYPSWGSNDDGNDATDDINDETDPAPTAAVDWSTDNLTNDTAAEKHEKQQKSSGEMIHLCDTRFIVCPNREEGKPFLHQFYSWLQAHAFKSIVHDEQGLRQTHSCPKVAVKEQF